MVVQEYTLGEKTLREELEARIRAQQAGATVRVRVRAHLALQARGQY